MYWRTPTSMYNKYITYKYSTYKYSTSTVRTSTVQVQYVQVQYVQVQYVQVQYKYITSMAVLHGATGQGVDITVISTIFVHNGSKYTPFLSCLLVTE